MPIAKVITADPSLSFGRRSCAAAVEGRPV
jgi:hypothetical protein